MKTRVRLNVLAIQILVTASVFFLVLGAHGATTKAETANELLEKVTQKLQTTSTYQADFVVTDIYPKAIKDLKLNGKVTLARNQKWRIETARFRRTDATAEWAASGNNTVSVSDGKTHSFEFIHPRSAQYRKQSVSKDVVGAALADLAPLSPFFAANPLKPLGAARLLSPTSWGGKQYKVIEAQVAAKAPVTAATAQIFIGSDLLIHRVLIQSKLPKGIAKKEWIFRNIVLNKPLPASSFVFQAQPGSQPFTPPDKSSKLLPIGSLAPDFTVHDSDGKTVRLSDYRGKTVVLDFWASWCWVCNRAMPSTAALARKYRDRNVVVLAVVIWDTPQSFKGWLRDNHYPEIDFAIDPKPQGEDVATRLYRVSVRPTVYVIDSEGKIRGTTEGFDGKSTDLENLIQKTLTPKTH